MGLAAFRIQHYWRKLLHNGRLRSTMRRSSKAFRKSLKLDDRLQASSPSPRESCDGNNNAAVGCCDAQQMLLEVRALQASIDALRDDFQSICCMRRDQSDLSSFSRSVV